jgi:hypothetical protein
MFLFLKQKTQKTGANECKFVSICWILEIQIRDLLLSRYCVKSGRHVPVCAEKRRVTSAERLEIVKRKECVIR